MRSWGLPCHERYRHPCFQTQGYKNRLGPIAETLSNRVISHLDFFTVLPHDLEVVHQLTKFLKE